MENYVGNTPLVRLQRLNPNPSNVILAKLEGNNPAGSVKDRPALSMINEAERRGAIKPGMVYGPQLCYLQTPHPRWIYQPLAS